MAEKKNAVVIGGSSGIGLATARALLERGASVHVVGRSVEKLDAARAEAAALVTHAADARSRRALEAVFRDAGRVDWLVLAASGGGGAGAVGELELDVLRDAFEAKLFAHLTAIQAALPHMAAQGSITFLSAISARAAIRQTAGLAAVNGAVEAIVKPLAVELAPIRVNAVSPGLVDTPWWSALPDDEREAYFAQAAAALPVGRIARPEAVADAVVLAATNPNITGTVIESDGGARLVTLA